MIHSKISRELLRLRLAAGLTPLQVAQRIRGRAKASSSLTRPGRRPRVEITADALTLYEGGQFGKPSIEELRVLAKVYGVPAWGLMKCAGYVTDQDALDGVQALRARNKRAA